MKLACSKCGNQEFHATHECHHGALVLTIWECTQCGHVIFEITVEVEQQEVQDAN